MKFRKFRSATVKNTTLTLCLLLGAMVAGCDESNDVSVEDHLKKAQELLDKADFRGSVIELKNVLQKEPGNANARLILSQVYAEVGDGASAEKEILQAQKLGLKSLDVTKALGRAYILTNKFKQVLEEFKVEDSDPASRKAAIYLLRGDAYYGTFKNVDAVSAYDNAIEAYRKDINEDRPHLKLTEPAESVDAMVGKTMVSIRRKNWPAATQRISKVLKVSPEDPAALAAKGEITFKQENAVASEEAYLAAFKAKPYNLNYQIGAARAQIALKKTEEAIVNLDAILKHFPDDIIANQYRGLAALHSGDNETAKRLADGILKFAPHFTPAHLIAGAANFGLRNYEQANILLSRFIAKSPSNHHARKLLGMTQLRLRRAKDALTTLQPLSKSQPKDSQTLNLIAMAAARTGDLTTAAAYYQKSAMLNPDDPEPQLKLAITKIITGNHEEGLQELQKSIKRAPTYFKSQYTLMNIYLNEKEFDKSIKVARALQASDIGNPASFIGEGMAQIGKESWAKAITAFQNALKIAPLHVGSSYGLAEVYLRTKQLDKVRQVYAKILDNQPGHLRTLMRQIGLEAKEGRKERINILIARAIKTNPTAIEPRILAAQELINLKKPIKAIASVKEFLSQNPNNIGLLNIVGQAQIAAKKSGAAVVTLERLVRNAPNSPGAHFLLAEAYSLIGNTDAVLLELKMALALQPKFLRAGVAQIRALAISGKEKQAVKELRALKSEFPDNSDITALEGWLASKMGQFAKAVRILKARMAKNPTEELAINLSTALWNGNQKLKSIRILKNWVHDHENSISARMELANNYALTNRPNDAIDTWRLVIARAPNQWLALNNLAANLTPSKPDEALGYAEQAYKIAPLVPQVAASLSEILMLNGIENTDRVIKILQPISRTFPKHFYAQLLIAKAQIQLGNQIIAKKILKRIIAQNPNENVRASIEEILEALKN